MTVLFDEADPRFYVADSTIEGAGKGLFARQALAKGERLSVIGVLVPAGSESDRCTHYADHYKFRAGNMLLIPMGYAAMANHSPHPNMVKVVEGDQVFLEVTRPVQPGEELFFTYSEYAQEAFGLKDRLDTICR